MKRLFQTSVPVPSLLIPPSCVPIELAHLLPTHEEAQYGASLLLVRPDQHVAWRGAWADRPTAKTIIDRVCGA